MVVSDALTTHQHLPVGIGCFVVVANEHSRDGEALVAHVDRLRGLRTVELVRVRVHGGHGEDGAVANGECELAGVGEVQLFVGGQFVLR